MPDIAGCNFDLGSFRAAMEQRCGHFLGLRGAQQPCMLGCCWFVGQIGQPAEIELCFLQLWCHCAMQSYHVVSCL
jgi:hypothetical protein